MNATGTPIAAAVSEIDTQGYSSAMIDVATGSPTGTVTTYTLTAYVEESDTSGGTFTDVSGATGTVTGVATTSSARLQIRVEGLGTSRKRYLRVRLHLSALGSAGALVPMHAVALLGRGYQQPPSNAATAP